MTACADMPTGYQPHDRHSPRTNPWEPLYACETEDAVKLAPQTRDPTASST